jgi:hypothetical protein
MGRLSGLPFFTRGEAMAQNPELHLWRAVLALALRDDDAAQWLRTDDAATVCSLAGVEREAVALVHGVELRRKKPQAA